MNTPRMLLADAWAGEDRDAGIISLVVCINLSCVPAPLALRCKRVKQSPVFIAAKLFSYAGRDQESVLQTRAAAAP